MGLKFKELIESHPTTLNELRHKTIVMDGMNVLYQFLSSIRGKTVDT